MQLQPVDLLLDGGGACDDNMRCAVVTDRSQLRNALGTDQIQPEIDFVRWVLWWPSGGSAAPAATASP